MAKAANRAAPETARDTHTTVSRRRARHARSAPADAGVAGPPTDAARAALRAPYRLRRSNASATLRADAARRHRDAPARDRARARGGSVRLRHRRACAT